MYIIKLMRQIQSGKKLNDGKLVNPFGIYEILLYSLCLAGMTSAQAASSAPVTISLQTLFPTEQSALLNSFNSSNNLRTDPLYRQLFENCRGYENPSPLCNLQIGVLGKVTLGAPGNLRSTEAMNRMLIIQPSGARNLGEIEINGGNLTYDPNLVAGTRTGVINITYFRTDPNPTSATSMTPFLRCEGEIVICGDDVGSCPSSEPARCTPVVTSASSHTTNTLGCSCATGQVLTSCFNNIPVCANPPGCPAGQIRLSTGECATEFTCASQAAALSLICEGVATAYDAPATGGPYYPAAIVCNGALAGCPGPGPTASPSPSASPNPPSAPAPTPAPPDSNVCQMHLTVGNVRPPTNATASDGQMSISATGGTGTVSYSISPTATSPSLGRYTGLQSTSYMVTATDSATPNSCQAVVNVNFTSSSNTTDCSCYDNLYRPHTYGTGMYRWSVAYSVACFRGAERYMPTSPSNGACRLMRSEPPVPTGTNGTWYGDPADETRNFGDCIGWVEVYGAQLKPSCP